MRTGLHADAPPSLRPRSGPPTRIEQAAQGGIVGQKANLLLKLLRCVIRDLESCGENIELRDVIDTDYQPVTRPITLSMLAINNGARSVSSTAAAA